MADTIRTRAAVLTLLADNTSNDISPQDHRDGVVSMFGVYAMMSVQGNSTDLAPGSPSFPELFNIFDTQVSTGLTVDLVTNYRSTVDTNSDGTFYFNFSTNFTGTNNAQVICALYKNGAITDFRLERKLSSGGDIGSASFCGIIDLVATDYVDIRWLSGGTSLIPQDAQLIIMRIK